MKCNERKFFIGQTKSRSWWELAQRLFVFNFHLKGPSSWKENLSLFNPEVPHVQRVMFPLRSLLHLELHSEKQTSPNPPPVSGEAGTPLRRPRFAVAPCGFLLHLKTSNQMHVLRSPNTQQNNWGNTAEETN